MDIRSMPTHAKGVANYANSALARMEAIKSGVDEAIMINSNGFVVEASAENVFFVKDGVIYTPPISTGALEGITRDTVIEITRQNKIPLRMVNRMGDDDWETESVKEWSTSKFNNNPVERFEAGSSAVRRQLLHHVGFRLPHGRTRLAKSQGDDR